jgi:lysophospholipase L1-like esterase
MTVWILAVALAAPALLLAAEVSCRWWIRRRSRYHVWPPRARIEIRPDPEAFPTLERRVRFHVNADGERGGDVGAGEQGLYRVLAVGGSAVECFALDQPVSWPGVLEQLLNEPERLHTLGARRVHVGNIGHSGVGSADLDLILERVLPQYRHLDGIIVMVGASDVYHWLEEGAPPSRPSVAVPEERLFSQHPQQRFGWRPGAWALVEIARRLRRMWLRHTEVKDRAGAWYVAARRMRAQATELRTAMPDATVVLNHFESHFRRVINRAQTHANRVLVVLQPWLEGPYTAEETAKFWHGGVGRPWKETVTAYYDLETVNRLLALVQERAATVAGALGVPHLDVLPLLNQRFRHFYDHDHYTPAGAAIVAQAIASAFPGRPYSHPPREARGKIQAPTRSSAGVPA